MAYYQPGVNNPWAAWVNSQRKGSNATMYSYGYPYTNSYTSQVGSYNDGHCGCICEDGDDKTKPKSSKNKTTPDREKQLRKIEAALANQSKDVQDVLNKIIEYQRRAPAPSDNAGKNKGLTNLKKLAQKVKAELDKKGPNDGRVTQLQGYLDAEKEAHEIERDSMAGLIKNFQDDQNNGNPDKLKRLEDEIKELEKFLAEKDDIIKHLQDHLKAYDDVSKQERRDSDKNIEELEGELNDTRQQLASNRRNSSALEEDLAGKLTDLKSARIHAKKLQQEKENLENQLQAKEKQLDDKDKQINDLTNATRGARRKSTQLENSLAQRENELNRLREDDNGQFRKAEDEIKDLQDQLGESEDKVRFLEEEVKDLEDKMDRLKRASNEPTAKLQQKDKEIRNLQKEVEALKKDLYGQLNGRDQDKDAVDKLKSELALKQEQLEDTQAKMEDLRKHVAHAHAELKAKENEVKDVKRSNEEPIEDLKKQLRNKEKELRASKTDVEQMAKHLQGSRRSSVKAFKGLEGKIQEKNRKIENLQNELKKKDEAFDDLLSQYTAADDEKDEWKQHVQQDHEELRGLTKAQQDQLDKMRRSTIREDSMHEEHYVPAMPSKSTKSLIEDLDSEYRTAQSTENNTSTDISLSEPGRRSQQPMCIQPCVEPQVTKTKHHQLQIVPPKNYKPPPVKQESFSNRIAHIEKQILDARPRDTQVDPDEEYKSLLKTMDDPYARKSLQAIQKGRSPVNETVNEQRAKPLHTMPPSMRNQQSQPQSKSAANTAEQPIVPQQRKDLYAAPNRANLTNARPSTEHSYPYNSHLLHTPYSNRAKGSLDSSKSDPELQKLIDRNTKSQQFDDLSTDNERPANPTSYSTARPTSDAYATGPTTGYYATPDNTSNDSTVSQPFTDAMTDNMRPTNPKSYSMTRPTSDAYATAKATGGPTTGTYATPRSMPNYSSEKLRGRHSQKSRQPLATQLADDSSDVYMSADDTVAIGISDLNTVDRNTVAMR